MKEKLLTSVAIVSIIISFFMLTIASYFIVASIFNLNLSANEIMKYSAVSMLAFILFLLFFLTLLLLHHVLKKDRFHQKLYCDINKSLDNISNGNFDTIIDTAKNHNEYHFIDLANRVNRMANELSGMETMRQDFISNVSHEIQSPLTSIRGFVTLLKNNKIEENKREHYIQIIEDETLRLSKLSDNLLKLSALESENAHINPISYPLEKQLREVVLLLEPQWSAKNIDLSIDGKSAQIVADRDLMSQVWINLLHNSIKFTPEKGKINIRIEKFDAGIQVSVADNGIGMDDNALIHIFERFYMADKARSRKAGGSGLGLSIVKKIIDMHHGTIKVESKIGVGTVFKVMIPKANGE